MIKFGVPTLDFLIGFDSSKRSEQTSGKNRSICIVGSPGTSKSILALHLAATQVALADDLLVLYVSTDLSLSLASNLLGEFGLDNYSTRIVDPYTKRQPAEVPYLALEDPIPQIRNFCLLPLNPESEQFTDQLIDFVRDRDDTAESNGIGFLDLAGATAGDDWRMILNLIEMIPQISNKRKKLMVIIDAIEGIEMLVGDSDQFGQPRSRRQRIAQLDRLLKEHQWALIIEDRSGQTSNPHGPSMHYDEEFMADIVLKLGFRDISGYTERFAQVTKCRSGVHQLGKHPMFLRDGTGSTSSGWSNMDDPRVSQPHNVTQSYAYVAQSIHSRAAALLSGRRGSI